MPEQSLAKQVEAIIAEHDEAAATDDDAGIRYALTRLGDLGFRDADEARANLAAIHESERRRAAE